MGSLHSFKINISTSPTTNCLPHLTRDRTPARVGNLAVRNVALLSRALKDVPTCGCSCEKKEEKAAELINSKCNNLAVTENKSTAVEIEETHQEGN